jgi:DNA replication protein DnaC
MNINPLKQRLRKLRLSGLAEALEVRLQEAQSQRLPAVELLELLVEDELTVRADRHLTRGIKAADFRELKTIDSFDFTFNSSVPAKLIHQLATAAFVRAHDDVLLIGPPGVGKSHLAQALGLCALKAGHSVYYRSIFDLIRDLADKETAPLNDRQLARYLKPDLLIIDDMGIKQLPARAGELLFEVILRRYENRSTIMTSNRPISDWGSLLGDVPSASAILDRFLHHAHVLTLEGRSYRLKNKAKDRAPSDSSRGGGKGPQSAATLTCRGSAPLLHASSPH